MRSFQDTDLMCPDQSSLSGCLAYFYASFPTTPLLYGVYHLAPTSTCWNSSTISSGEPSSIPPAGALSLAPFNIGQSMLSLFMVSLTIFITFHCHRFHHDLISSKPKVQRHSSAYSNYIQSFKEPPPFIWGAPEGLASL